MSGLWIKYTKIHCTKNHIIMLSMMRKSLICHFRNVRCWLTPAGRGNPLSTRHMLSRRQHWNVIKMYSQCVTSMCHINLHSSDWCLGNSPHVPVCWHTCHVFTSINIPKASQPFHLLKWWTLSLSLSHVQVINNWLRIGTGSIFMASSSWTQV